MKTYDFLIIGSGIAGLTAAHLLSELGTVAVVTKGSLKDSNSRLAQGGIAAVLDARDSFKSHIQDTMKAGAGHNDAKAVKKLVEKAPEAIRWLKSIGVRFRPKPHLEGGHSFPRVWHTGDRTGETIIETLIRSVKKKKNIFFSEDREVVRLIVRNKRCIGAYTSDSESILSRFTILATGGYAGLYARTTNTPQADGSGLELALQVGLRLRDLEFVQFHPTALNVPPKSGRYFLISEAVRGFGAKVVNNKGEEFLKKIHPLGSLAPRDIATRGIFATQKKGPVFLDLRHLNQKKFKKEFPLIFDRLKKEDLDIARDLIPVTPVAHYTCGGIPTDFHGRTKLPGLYAVGEVACTGAQGANRLASNSLLEGVVFAMAAAEEIRKKTKNKNVGPRFIAASRKQKAKSKNIPLFKLRQLLWSEVGIVRSRVSLRRAQRQIASLKGVSPGHKALALAIIRACLKRPRSLGAHSVV